MTVAQLPTGTEVRPAACPDHGEVTEWRLRAGAGWFVVRRYVDAAGRPATVRVQTGPAGTPLSGIEDHRALDDVAALVAAASCWLRRGDDSEVAEP